jgi:hypothetical protein
MREREACGASEVPSVGGATFLCLRPPAKVVVMLSPRAGQSAPEDMRFSALWLELPSTLLGHNHASFSHLPRPIGIQSHHDSMFHACCGVCRTPPSQTMADNHRADSPTAFHHPGRNSTLVLDTEPGIMDHTRVQCGVEPLGRRKMVVEE